MIDNSEKFNGGKTGLVEQEILRQIDLGNFRRNSLLPSERELAKQLGVSYMTVRRAIGCAATCRCTGCSRRSESSSPPGRRRNMRTS